MAKWHNTGGSGTTIVTRTFVFHYLVPLVNQEPSIAKDPRLIDFVSEVPDISTTERDEIVAGRVIEETVTIRCHHTEEKRRTDERITKLYDEREPKSLRRFTNRYRDYLSTESP